MTSGPHIAIIGGGISGLSCVHHLHNDFQLTLFEQHGKLGGHTDTHKRTIDGKQTRIDSGFIIFCPDYYPHFSSMLDTLGVEKQATDMSFAAHNPNSKVFYNATTSLNKMFCQRRNLLRPRFWRMLLDIVRFYTRSPKVLDRADGGQTVSDYLRQHHYGPGFTEDHLLPMISALWSTSPAQVEQYPIHHLVDFFSKHGLLKIFRRPTWYVVKNGSASYVEALAKQSHCDFKLDCKITTVARTEDGVVVKYNGQSSVFDAVIFCCHADQALAMMETPSNAEQEVLAAIPFEENAVVVHSDESQMPANKLAWASWNTSVPKANEQSASQVCTATYWMNLLQSLPLKTNVFTALNSGAGVTEAKTLVRRSYHHPTFTPRSVAAQKRKAELDGQQHSYFAGAYWGWGFHEDGARSAFEVCQQIRQDLLCTA